MMPVSIRASLSSSIAAPVALKSNQRSFATGKALKVNATLPSRRRASQLAATSRGAVKVMAASYICVDCGYIYDGSEGPFEKLPNNYKCPACNSPKRRFQTWSGPGGKKNDPKSMKSRMQSLKSGGGASTASSSSGGDSNPLVFVAIGAAVLGGLYFALNGYYN